MDFYDPQTLSVMVFGGFMLVSAIGIFLVSTFSMKETSYEEALAKQRRELEKASQPKVEKKKKEKPAEKKGKAKKREEKPNGQIAEPEPDVDAAHSAKEANPEPVLVTEPVVQAPVGSLAPPPPPPLEKEKLTPSPKEKKKKEKKVVKEEMPPSLAISTPPATVSKDLISDMVPKEKPVAAFPQQNASFANSVAVKNQEALGNQEEQKQDGTSKKKAVAKKKRESTTTDVESMLYVPYQTLCSIINSMAFGEGEAQQLIEILTEKAGGAQDPWLMATQKSDPLAVLKRQLEEKEKQLAMEQENASVAKAKLRELTKELAAEKAKTLAIENKWKEQQLTHEQEMSSVQARMQASYQDHLTEMQQLQGKIRTLQEQLENGPNTQLARLQQENSILRDALNQATSQTESKQNAELAKLRQECSRLSKELTEKLEVLQQVEEQKKALETKATACEEQICQLQISQKEREVPLQKRLDEISEELHKSQASCQSLQKELEKAKEQQPSLAELQSKLQGSEMEVKRKGEELNLLQMKLSEVTSQNVELTERLKSTEALLEANHMREEEKNKAVQESSQIDVSLLQLRLQESSAQVSTLEKEAAELKDTVEQLKRKNHDLQEKNQEATEALISVEKSYEGKLLSSAKSKEASEQQFGIIQEHTKKVLLSLFPQILLDDQENYDEWLQQFKEKALDTLQEKAAKSDSGTAVSLKEANESLSTLQAECDQYRTILAQTEGMLKDLQKSVEKEELVWEAKLSASEEALKKSQDEMKCLQDDVEKFKMELQKTEKLKEYTSLLEAQLENHLATSDSEHQNYTKEVEHLRELLSESQNNLEATKKEALKQSQELVQAKDLVNNLQSELGKLRLAGSTSSSANEDVLQLQKTLDKEKKLTKDLGCAATKLKELLKVTQEQLAKERETVTKLQEQLQERGENEDNAKEGTSV
nr:ribosome-binding protein 1 isoform X1 [Pogona vitticeps]